MSNRLPGRRGGRAKRASGGFPTGIKRRTRGKELPSTSAAPSDTTPDNPSPSEV
ncbi:hypothetical protein ACFWGE_24960 [Streptomyces bacillaris]|uniref:hypothetical protein n=1 Tax=Streptomyces TaxID=1883 RepID=UPI0013B42D25|nr:MULTISPECIES: hypothetical protein [Streptomyces]MBH0243633.1 hypothetical protein [Streptomyces cavourensis]NUV41429.1 hypothetical protein [Streptomyces sp. CAI-24]WAE65718.1 hypothetical protein OUQ49_08145 [Streptomyces cavourensis]